jgi:hypothetical protein
MRWQLLSIVFLLTSCNPAKQLARLQTKHPYLFEAVTIRDTITVTPPPIISTSTLIRQGNDTLKVRESNFTLDIHVTDTTVFYNAKCTPDTIRVPYQVDCPPTSKIPQKSNNTLIIILLTIIGVLILFLIVVK